MSNGSFKAFKTDGQQSNQFSFVAPAVLKREKETEGRISCKKKDIEEDICWMSDDHVERGD